MLHLSRRRFALGALGLLPALPLGSALAAAYPPGLTFAAWRGGKRIGEQRMSFEAAGEALTVRTQVEMAVKIGPVTVYRYVHDAAERWSGRRFESLETRTTAGGARESVTATRTADGVTIQTAKGRTNAAPGALPFTHWNLEIGRAPLFHPQTGKLLKIAVRETAAAPVMLGDGRTVEARRLTFSGDAQIENWYGADGIWTGLRGRLDDGSTLEYRRL